MNEITINDTYGAGKTTLLICIDRLCNSLALVTRYANISSWKKADQFHNFSIRYVIDNSSVQFRKRRARWTLPLKTGSGELLEKFGFSESVFIRADSKRIDVKPDDLCDIFSRI